MESLVANGDVGLLMQSMAPQYFVPGYIINMDVAAFKAVCSQTQEQKAFDWNKTVNIGSNSDSCQVNTCAGEMSPPLSRSRKSSVSGSKSDAKFWINMDLNNLMSVLCFEEYRAPSIAELLVSWTAP